MGLGLVEQCLLNISVVIEAYIFMHLFDLIVNRHQNSQLGLVVVCQCHRLLHG